MPSSKAANPVPLMHASPASTMPCPVLPIRRSWPLHDTAASRAAEQRAALTLPPHTLMARAGHATARLALAIAPHALRVDICCGPGNNGGDGLVAAVDLKRLGRDVRLWHLGASDRLPDDAADALRKAREAGLTVHTGPPERLDADLVIDALLGLGGRGIESGPLAQAASAMLASGRTVLAIDLPSGLDGDTGRVPGGLAVRAEHSLSLLSLKPGLFTGSGRELAGQVWFDDLGAAPADDSATALLVGPDRVQWLLPRRRHDQHKGSFGNVVVLGGATGMVGAAWLAARGALGSGAGRVWVAPLGGGSGFDPTRPELMWRSSASVLQHAVLMDSTVVCGCGGGDAVREPLPTVLHHAARLVLDADALNAVAAEPALASALRARAQRGLPTVLTPHPLEAARLLGCSVTDVQADRLQSAGRLAAQLACVVVLKGSGTVVATPTGLPLINASGNARLATAGTGDVLAGWIGGHWSQIGQGEPSAVDAATASVHLHGRAADRSPTQGPLLAADLVDAMVDAADTLRAAAR